jgi:hypothetical protein
MNPQIKELVINLMGMKELMRLEGKPQIKLLRMDVLISTSEILHIQETIEDLNEDQCKKLIEMFESIKTIVSQKPEASGMTP